MRPRASPTISSTGSGIPRAGNTLTAGVSAVMDANGIPDDISYQWMSSDGTTDTDIEGATASTYTLTGSEPGPFIKVRGGFTDHAGYEESLTSDGVGIQRLSDIWVATLTVGAHPSGTIVGYGTGIRGDSLSDDLVTIGGHAYGITRIVVFPSSSKLALNLVRRIGTEVLSEAEIANLVLDVDGTEFPRANAAFSGGTELSWANSGLDWPQGEELRVSLKVLNTAATGQPAITGRLRVGRTLTADMSGIVDANGIPDDPSYTYQLGLQRRHDRHRHRGRHGVHLYAHRVRTRQEHQGAGRLHRQPRVPRGTSDQRRHGGGGSAGE